MSIELKGSLQIYLEGSLTIQLEKKSAAAVSPSDSSDSNPGGCGCGAYCDEKRDLIDLLRNLQSEFHGHLRRLGGRVDLLESCSKQRKRKRDKSRSESKPE